MKFPPARVLAAGIRQQVVRRQIALADVVVFSWPPIACLRTYGVDSVSFCRSGTSFRNQNWSRANSTAAPTVAAIPSRAGSHRSSMEPAPDAASYKPAQNFMQGVQNA